MKTGLVSITFRNLQAEEIVGLVSEAKLGGVEWGGDEHVPHGHLQRAQEVKQMTADAGLEVSSYGSYYRFEDCISYGSDSGPAWNAVLDTASELGAPSIRVWAGRSGSQDTTAMQRERIVERCREIAEQARLRGITVDLEYHDNTLTDSNESAALFLKEVGHPNLFTFWQPYLSMDQSYRLEGLQQLGERVSNVHCYHFAKEGWPHSLLLEEGEEPWKEFLEVLRSDGRERWISIEHVKDHSIENFRKDATTLRSWIRG
ncbi:sugar phosphate isomerase/epimerase [Pelagicoccus sp. SDUM812002]|uniref:sugar phosphate isomerase/epimerase family protein n=1 Tax=Pelagicoccus sp. SDUM812002 TaxID=3041266 RepID=UPI00280F9B23|nr:sugar phosphate isomerase/epimerase [Pelagicoccus sp. SDUM812002]MDQ8187708.1 sugar phosphate isomerase/epimerase [Pelagicoccus sp. SDUM812002]